MYLLIHCDLAEPFGDSGLALGKNDLTEKEVGAGVPS
jgi:hypothetical protein